ncbi:DUF262 domain-containing protein [Streptomyces sp. Vc74B-19]|uniref:DUF262 domain-containing protein n=1 Tax=unclassified Streptomyces TaxID=2593676 RepID=UPI001BFC0730|nr:MULTISPECIES: DUF262 domain-containing protein [unclassified Streptomyces]MBT3166113.1 DUF262 domain-containing protein [Streptomyces sp. Vc74B-19]MCO4699982.1 hypothetical protein [Streptomyces sp. RO-S4]MDU0301950.1 DUF262 domain-containing protein [Streptomyces sp. PAL114]
MAGVTKPKVGRIEPLELVEAALSGRIRIPRFQRSYRWEASDSERLFDSILRGYPIGNLLMWRKPAPAAEITLGELRFDAPERSDALWVVDGQQRLTTLIGALTASEHTVDRRFRIFYDLREKDTRKRFLSAPHSRTVRDHWLPVWVAGDNKRLIAWQRERPWLTEEEYDLCDSVATAIRTYEIPVYEIEGDDEQALREIFDRMNTFGKALKRAEIFQALHSAPLDVQPSDLDALRERVGALDFGEFSPQLLMQSVMATRGGQVDRDFRQEFKDDEDRQQAFARTEKALRLVVDWLRDEAGIPHLRLLPYALYVPVLTRFAALFGRPTGRGSELLRRWIWRGAAVGAAPQGNTVALRRNAGAVHDDPVASATRVLGLLPIGGELWKPDLTQTPLNRTQTKINVLGLLSAHPVLLTPATDSDGNHYPAGTRLDDSRLLTDMLNSGISPLQPLVSGRSMAAKVLHPAHKTGSDLLSEQWDPAALRSHCMDERCVELLRLNTARSIEEFLARRADIMTRVISDHVQRMALFGFSDGPETETLFDESIWGDDTDAA